MTVKEINPFEGSATILSKLLAKARALAQESKFQYWDCACGETFADQEGYLIHLTRIHASEAAYLTHSARVKESPHFAEWIGLFSPEHRPSCVCKAPRYVSSKAEAWKECERISKDYESNPWVSAHIKGFWLWYMPSTRDWCDKCED